MFSAIFNYVKFVIIFIILGMTLTIIGEANRETLGDGPLTVGAFVGSFSPVWAGIVMYMRRGRDKNKSNESIKVMEQDTQEKLNSIRRAKDQENAEIFRKEMIRKRFLESSRLIDCVERHKATLIRKLALAVRKNDYGRVFNDTTPDVLEEFFVSIDIDHSLIPFEEAAALTLEQLGMIQEELKGKGFEHESLPNDGLEFEKWVADALSGFGWDAEVTVSSGDQGIDVIASKDGRRVGLQCKLYGSAVGNKAVQEAHAGKVFYGLDAVAVITNANYTSSAEDLAKMTGVFLLSHHDLPDLAVKVLKNE